MINVCCAMCRCEMVCKKNSRLVVHGGLARYGDEWGCSSCGALIVTGFGSVAFEERYEPDNTVVVRSAAVAACERAQQALRRLDA